MGGVNDNLSSRDPEFYCLGSLITPGFFRKGIRLLDNDDIAQNKFNYLGIHVIFI